MKQGQDSRRGAEASARDPCPARVLSAALRSSGIGIFGFLGRDRLAEACSGLSEATAERYGLSRAHALVAAALPYGEGPPEPPDWARGMPGPLAAIARFARADWYAELRSRLSAASEIARAEMRRMGTDSGPAREWRCLVNSGLPERGLAVAAGIGTLGRHGLVMVPDFGSAVLLGLLLLPGPIAGAEGAGIAREATGAADSATRTGLHESCESCGACVAACPTKALAFSQDRGIAFTRELCLQHWSSIAGPLPPQIEAAWGNRLYGCDLCQEACPLFSPDSAAQSARGLLGPGLPASWVASASPDELRARLSGSALGMKWISPEALARNARIACGAKKDLRGV